MEGVMPRLGAALYARISQLSAESVVSFMEVCRPDVAQKLAADELARPIGSTERIRVSRKIAGLVLDKSRKPIA